MPLVNLCEHCSTEFPGKARFCPQCRTAEGRKKQDEANNELWQEVFKKPCVCKYCEAKKEERILKRQEDERSKI